MATKFSLIYNRFFSKITDDMYLELTPQDTINDLSNLIEDAIPKFEFPRFNAYDYTKGTKTVESSEVTDTDFVIGTAVGGSVDQPKVIIDNSTFTADLTKEEIDILAILMVECWLQRQIASIELTRMKYSTADFKLTSQANHLQKLMTLSSELNRQSNHSQRLYKRRKLNSDGQYVSNWSIFRENE